MLREHDARATARAVFPIYGGYNVRKSLRLSSMAASAFLLLSVHSTFAQSFVQQFAAHNSRMTAVQPSWITPLVEADPRLLQYVRFSFSNEYTPSRTLTTSYGNARGGGIIAGDRYEFDIMPPAYFQHNSTAQDGFGDMSALAKYRIASGNADHGNYIVTAMLAHCFATGSYKNGALTDSYSPTLAGGVGLGRKLEIESTLGGTLPTGKVATQGRTITWNSLIQTHATKHFWGEVENNATFYFEGSHDGKMQNFVTPAVFYVIRRKEWNATHPFFIIDSGMQIATSGFHTYNHNLITEMRMLF
jgi:hypothetical protein